MADKGTKSQALINEYQELRDLWLQCWGKPLTKRQAQRLLYCTGWPDDMRDVLVKLRFLRKAAGEAHSYMCYEQTEIEQPAIFVFAGLFKGDRWLFYRTWEAISSSQELYGWHPKEQVSDKFKDILRQML